MQNVKLVRIEYWIEKAETGIHFDGNMLHTNNQIRRARCWFPCIDDSSQRCWYEHSCLFQYFSHLTLSILNLIKLFHYVFSYDLEFTVPRSLVAVSNGSLLYQVREWL